MSNAMLLRYNLAEGVTAFSTKRAGGVSQGAYASFNINALCGDSAEHIAANRRLLADELHIAAHCIVMPHQVHGTDSQMIAADFFGLSEGIRQMVTDGRDALMTNLGGVCIGVSTADCIPVLLYDALHHAAAAVHAGWRGTVKCIVQRTVADMQRCYGTNPAQLQAVIGPGISLKNFEVGQEVYDQFAQAGFDMPHIAQLYEKWHIDLPACNRLQLEAAGVKADRILQTDICTYDCADEFFSARKLGTASGRIFTGILLA